MKRKMLGVAVTVAIGLVVTFCFAGTATATVAEEIDARVDAAIQRFQTEVNGGKELMEKADGALVFPSVVKAGLVVGGAYGEGALRIDGKTVNYYSTTAGSIGLQAGAQSQTIVILFFSKDALQQFQDCAGWEVGVDGSVALINIGASGTIDTMNIKDPIAGFILTNKGLMVDASLEGTKFTKIVR